MALVGAAPASASERRVLLLAYAAVLAASVAFVAPIVLAPWLRSAGHPWIAGVLYAGYSTTCHQLPDRSYWLLGSPLAVCSRCASIYAGVLLGLALAPARGLRAPMPRRRSLLAAAAPASADFLLGWLGLVENSFLSRGLTGVALGAVSAFYILPGLMEAIASLLGPKSTHGEAHGTEHEEARDR
jgi:uncharacterized membrane protein